MEQWQQGMSAEVADAGVLAAPTFTARQFDREADYGLAAHWWTQHGWPVVPVEALPLCGILIEVDTGSLEGVTPLCASFMYRDAGWGCIAWTVADAEAPRELRRAAVDFAVATLTSIGDTLGLTWLYTATRNPAMQDRYTRLGWVACEDDFQQFIRVRPSEEK